jgi:DNA/RNA endonuclease YhcR with UshA esterase domain
MIRFLFFLLFTGGLIAQECAITTNNALEYKGKEVTVCGVVSQVSTPLNNSGNPTYFNFGGYYPNHKFTAVLWESNKSNFRKDLDYYDGKRVAITGVIQEYRGKAQIVLVYPEQIVVIE